jgi:non-ribosomal peptide synthetase component F
MLGYWRERLAGEIPALELPDARPAGAATSMRGDRLPIALGDETTAAVYRLARAEGVTLFVALLAAFQALLHRVTRVTDIAVGSPIANRNHPEIEGLIGYFVNTLVMRGDLSGDPPFRELVRRLREVALGAYAHQDLPFTKLVEALRPDRAASRTPLFQVMFMLQNTPAPPLEAPGAGLTLAPVESPAQIATFDLELLLHDAGDHRGITGWILYNRDLLGTGAVAALGERFRLLLESAVADPGRRLSELSLVTEEERRQLLAGPRPRFERLAAAEIDERDVWAGPSPLAARGASFYGGVLAEDESPAETPEALAGLVKAERVTVLALSPELFAALADWVAAAPRRDAALRTLRWVIVDGEPDVAAVRAWSERFGERRARVMTAPADLRPFGEP